MILSTEIKLPLTDLGLVLERGLDWMLDGMLHMRTSIAVVVLPFINLSHIIANKQYINIVPISP